VSFTAPTSDGGSPISRYTATCTKTNGGGTESTHATTSPITVTGLKNGSTYRCVVEAKNAIGTGPPSAQSNPVTPH
jgi:hypothetical protein